MIYDIHLSILLVEDDKENLELLEKSLPSKINDCHLHYDSCDSFEKAFDLLSWRHYDMIVTDIYRGGDKDKKTNEDDAEAKNIINEIRKRRFCPIVAFTDGSFPLEIDKQKGPFLKLVDKTQKDEIENSIKNLISTGIPRIARILHDEIDSCSGPSFLWKFLEKRWDELKCGKFTQYDILERIIRRRISKQFSHLKPYSNTSEEVSEISAPEFYIIPPISKNYRLGHILKQKEKGDLCVILTPHCFLEIQPSTKTPRSDYVLIVKTIPFIDVIRKEKKPWKADNKDENLEKLRRRILSPAQIGQPRGRYWFMPGFLDIPDLYCDFLQIANIPYKDLFTTFDTIATLDTPFAEALQSCFISFYSSVGLPNLKPEEFNHLIKNERGENDQST